MVSFSRFQDSRKTASWKQSDLSLAGCSCLLQTITKTTSNYMMNCHALPKQILSKINQQSSFWWGKFTKHFCRFIKWSNIVVPKIQVVSELDGMRIRTQLSSPNLLRELLLIQIPLSKKSWLRSLACYSFFWAPTHLWQCQKMFFSSPGPSLLGLLVMEKMF